MERGAFGILLFIIRIQPEQPGIYMAGYVHILAIVFAL